MYIVFKNDIKASWDYLSFKKTPFHRNFFRQVCKFYLQYNHNWWWLVL